FCSHYFTLPLTLHTYLFFFFFIILPPPPSTLFPSRRSSDLSPSAFPRSAHAASFSVDFEFPNRSCWWCSIRRRPKAKPPTPQRIDRKSTRLNSSHLVISYAVFCLKKKKKKK